MKGKTSAIKVFANLSYTQKGGPACSFTGTSQFTFVTGLGRIKAPILIYCAFNYLRAIRMHNAILASQLKTPLSLVILLIRLPSRGLKKRN